MIDHPISATHDVFDELIRQWEVDFPGESSSPIAIAMRIRHLYQLDQTSLQLIFAQFDIGLGEIDVLTHVAQHSNSHRLRPSDLADACMVTTGAITGRLTRLEQRGYITRVPSPSDKRTIYVEITDAGRDLLQRTRKEVAKSSQLLRAVRSLPEADQKSLSQGLSKLLRVLAP